MTVTLRLTRRGKKSRPAYRVVAADNARPRDGRFLEVIGTFNPLTEPATVTLKEDRVRYWLSVGAQQSLLVKNLIKKQIPGLIEEREKTQRSKIQAKRKKRKEKLKKKGSAKKTK